MRLTPLPDWSKLATFNNPVMIRMKPEWKSFLTDNGAEFDDEERVLHFGNPERERRVALSGLVFADLSHYGLIGVHGPDTVSFLQNQFTNDVTAIDATHAQLSGWCTAKGRLLALFLHFIHGDTHFLRLPRERVEPMLSRIGKYVLRSKVTFEDAGEALVRFGVSGPNADIKLGEVLGKLPESLWSVHEKDGIRAIRIPGPHHRFELYGELEPLQKLWERLNVHGAPVGAEGWTLLNVIAGLPEIHESTVESFVPQMVNLHLLDGLSFRKGCYPGQEVVARSQYLGKIKRRMFGLRIEGIDVPAPGTPVVTEGGADAGEIVTAALHPDGHVVALGVMILETVTTEAMHIGGSRGARAAAFDLPGHEEAE